jgi:ATP-dependent Clp protease ATP-binding subunit ClpC
MAETDEGLPTLTPGARKLVFVAIEKQRHAGHPHLGTHHWLLALIERHGPMAESMSPGFEVATQRRPLREKLFKGDLGQPLDVATVVREATHRAHQRGKALALERDLAAVILAANSFPVADASERDAASLVLAGPSVEIIEPHAPAASPTPITLPESDSYHPRLKDPTPALDFFGRDLTRQAAEGKLGAMVGREEELQLVIETLCRRTKRNPVLVGPAGVGKTAIVEGLAQRVVRNEVPAALHGVRIVALQPSAVVAGSNVVGELEQRMQAMLVEAAKDGIIVFIDEIHSVIGSGGMPGTSDMASQLKPALARGDLACIAATTTDEYRRFIEPDTALERRFQPVRVQELTPDQAQTVLLTLREELSRLRQVEIREEVVPWLVNFAQVFLRNRHFPDKGVDLLEQCVAHAVMKGKKTVELADAETVAQRMVGMPISIQERLGTLRSRLLDLALLTEEDITSLVNRLQVTLRGLDLRPIRPNAVVLLMGETAANAEALSATISEVLFGGEDRVVRIDFSRFLHPADLSMLIGAPPGYIGYSDALPLHRVAQIPWCVLLGEKFHACNPQVREVFVQALASGFITDARGKRIYLSDSIIMLTADEHVTPPGTFGFGQAGEAPASLGRRIAEDSLGPEFVAQCDLICTHVLKSESARRRWFHDNLLSDLSIRYAKEGVHVRWDDSIVGWLVDQAGGDVHTHDWERLVDERLTPLLIDYLPKADNRAALSLLVKYVGDKIQIEPQQSDTKVM